MESWIIRFFRYLSDWKFHSSQELNLIWWFNFKDKIFQLKKKGCKFEKINKWNIYSWKMTEYPRLIIVKWKLINAEPEEIVITKHTPKIEYYEDKKGFFKSLKDLFFY